MLEVTNNATLLRINAKRTILLHCFRWIAPIAKATPKSAMRLANA